MTAAFGWSEKLLELEALLERPPLSPTPLRQLGEPAQLQTLFYLELCRLVRSGPPRDSSRVTVAGLVRAAGHAAAAGLAPLSLPAYLRATLTRLALDLRDRGCWKIETPLWWEPLPAADDLEKIGAAVSLSLPRRDLLETGLRADNGGFLHLPGVLDGATRRRLHCEIEAAWKSGLLSLEQGRVGADDRRSSARNDRTGYFNGFEESLLQDVPALAALIQWGLTRLAPTLAEALPATHLASPQRAMLSRFPAPSGGFAPHFDNPGGARDNGRALTLVVYLNPPGEPVRGGELTAWRPGSGRARKPSWRVEARGGDAVLFDSRRVLHQVRRVEAGPARWALTFWFNDRGEDGASSPPLPELTWKDAIAAVESPPLSARAILFRDLASTSQKEQITIHSKTTTRLPIGVVTTVAATGPLLDAWCRHHSRLGFDRLIVVLDSPRESSEEIRSLTTRYSPALTIWTRRQAARRWDDLQDPRCRELMPLTSGSSSQAVACRQSLNASAALAAARRGEWDEAPLDWLLHIDLDEWFWPLGEGQGGAGLGEHFAALSANGHSSARYLNHELLLPLGDQLAFKLNPRLAAERLGASGWGQLKRLLTFSSSARPYFCGYQNGKAAVRVAAGAAAAGVHGWRLETSNAQPPLLNGPIILHFPCASANSFRRKFLEKATSARPELSLFEPSPVEKAALEVIESAREQDLSEEATAGKLARLHKSLTHFSRTDRALLEEAGLLLRPEMNRELSYLRRCLGE